MPAFHQGLAQLGFFEGRNVLFEYRWAESQNNRLSALASDLARLKVDAIAAMSTPAAPAAKLATSTIPIVFVYAGDPVAAGLVASLAHPGGNLTGSTGMGVELVQKQLQVLKELLPAASKIAVLINPTSPTAQVLSKDVQTAEHTLNIQTPILLAGTENEIDQAFASLSQLGASALLIAADVLFTTRTAQLAALARRYAVPAIYSFRQFAEVGGLMSYGGNLLEGYRTAGIYIGRILKGEKPADLPVQQATKIELVLNLKTAKALGLDVPTGLLVRADEVIE
jgi:putative ABC transport system substrate-binding protein